jgi:hypothetical protein
MTATNPNITESNPEGFGIRPVSPELMPAARHYKRRRRALVPAVAASGALAFGLIAGYHVPHPAPADCVAAIDTADQVFGHVGTVLGYVGDGFESAARFDVTAMNQAADAIGSEGRAISPLTDKYKGLKEKCR